MRDTAPETSPTDGEDDSGAGWWRDRKRRRYLSAAPALTITDRLVIRPLTWADRRAHWAMSLHQSSLRANGWGSIQIDNFKAVAASRSDYETIQRGSLACLIEQTGDLAVVVARDVITGGAHPGLHIGVTAHPEHRGRGYAGEALAAVLPLLQPPTDVWLGTSVDNSAIRRIMTDLGYAEPAPEPHVLPNGREVSSLWYRIHSAP